MKKLLTLAVALALALACAGVAFATANKDGTTAQSITNPDPQIQTSTMPAITTERNVAIAPAVQPLNSREASNSTTATTRREVTPLRSGKIFVAHGCFAMVTTSHDGTTTITGAQNTAPMVSCQQFEKGPTATG